MSSHPSTGWRKSARSNGGTACVEATTDGTAVTVRNSNQPDGARLTVSAADWLTFLDDITTGRLDHTAITTEVTSGPFLLAPGPGDGITLRDVDASSDPSVAYTALEWTTFTTGVVHDGEFSLAWLLAARTTAS